jgi:hypothetical protein
MGKRIETIKKLRRAGLALQVLGTIVAGFLIYSAHPGEVLFYTLAGVGTLIFCLGALMYFAYEAFIPEFWKGTWVPGPGHEYPSDP